MTEHMKGPDDEATIDVVAYARQLWRDKFLVLAITLACGAIGWGLARTRTPVYVGDARVSVMQAGSAASYDAILKFRVAVESESVLTAALARIETERPGLSMTAADLVGRVSSRIAFPPNIVHVEVTWPGDADLPSRLAMIIAEEGLAAAKEAHLQQLASAREQLRTDFDASTTRLNAARKELDAFRRQNQQYLDSILERAEQFYVRREMRMERERIASFEKDLAGLEPSSQRHGELTTLATEARARIARLQARDALLSDEQRQVRPPAEHAHVLQRDAELLADVSRAEQMANVLVENGNRPIAAILPMLSALEIVRTPHVPARAITAQRTGLTQGLAIGLVLSVFIVLTYGAFKPR